MVACRCRALGRWQHGLCVQVFGQLDTWTLDVTTQWFSAKLQHNNVLLHLDVVMDRDETNIHSLGDDNITYTCICILDGEQQYQQCVSKQQTYVEIFHCL